MKSADWYGNCPSRWCYYEWFCWDRKCIDLNARHAILDEPPLLKLIRSYEICVWVRVWFLVAVVVCVSLSRFLSLARSVRFLWIDSNCGLSSDPLFHTSTCMHIFILERERTHTPMQAHFNDIHHPWLTFLLLCAHSICFQLHNATILRKKKRKQEKTRPLLQAFILNKFYRS